MTPQEHLHLFEKLCGSAAAYGYVVSHVRLSADEVELDLLPMGPSAVETTAETAQRESSASAYGQRAAAALGFK